MSKRKTRRKPPPRTAPVPELMVHATTLTLPSAAHTAAFNVMVARSPALVHARATAEAQGLNPMAVIYAVFERMGANAGLTVRVVGTDADVARVNALADKLHAAS